MTDDERPDRHRGHRRTIRPPNKDWDDAKRILGEHGWEVNEFLSACLKAAVGSTDRMLGSLSRFRAPPTKGRPPKAAPARVDDDLEAP